MKNRGQTRRIRAGWLRAKSLKPDAEAVVPARRGTASAAWFNSWLMLRLEAGLLV